LTQGSRCEGLEPFDPRVKPEDDGRDKPGHDKVGESIGTFI
jgi:hypothetical protein